MTLIRKIYKIITVGYTLYIACWLYTSVFKLLLRINAVEYGSSLRTFNAVPSLVVSNKAQKFSLGSNVTFNNYLDQSWNSKCKIYVREGASLSIGNNSGMNGVLIYCAQTVIIGDYVNIGGGTRISDTNHHNLDWQKRRDPRTNIIAKTSPIVIEDDVFIGANCYIGKGVTLGARSIIAAGSVVTKSIPSDCMAGGNPCKVIKKLNITG